MLGQSEYSSALQATKRLTSNHSRSVQSLSVSRETLALATAVALVAQVPAALARRSHVGLTNDTRKLGRVLVNSVPTVLEISLIAPLTVANPRIHSETGEGLKGPRHVQCNGTPDGEGCARFPVQILPRISGAIPPKSAAIRSIRDESQESAASRI